jgi:hypothetical protein
LGVDGDAFVLTTCKQNPGPIARAVYVLHRAEKVDIFGADDIIRYGQKVKIECNPHIYRKKLFVASTPQSSQCYSPESRKQEASCHSIDHYVGTWIVETLDPNFRFECEGQPVKANEPLLFRHAQTGHYLASDTVRHGNEFGGEWEVMCHSFHGQNKTQNLQLEKTGHSTADIPARFQHEQNHFVIVTAPDASFSKAIEELHKFSIEDLIAEIKAKILERSAGGIKGIARIFRAMDDNGNAQLDCDDFRWGFIDYGFNLSKEEAAKVMEQFDHNKDGTVNFDEFLRFLKVSVLTTVF